jgi:hypothetical protein
MFLYCIFVVLIRPLHAWSFVVSRLKRVLVRVPIFIGIAICVKKYFSGGSDKEAKNNMTESDQTP